MFHVKHRGRMARKKNNDRIVKNRRGRRRGFLSAFLIVALGIGGFLGWMNINASLTHLKYAEVYLKDLPAQFEGTKLLFISDINIRNASDMAATKRTMTKLQELGADILILGGDYSADTLLSSLNGGNGMGKAEYAAEFIQSLSDFYAPLGKFAVSGESDTVALTTGFSNAGVQHLSDACAVVEKNGTQLVLAGLGDTSAGRTPYEEIGGYFNGDECVIAVAHNPSTYIGVRVAEAKGGGAWADLVLAGHTLGGQIKLFGKTMRSLPEEEERCLAGWHYTNDLPMLVSQGLGCKGAKLRLGTQSEVWCITLHKPAMEGISLPKL